VDQGLAVPLDLTGVQAVTVVAILDIRAITTTQQNLWEFGTDTVGTRRGFSAYFKNTGFEAWVGSGGTARDGNVYASPTVGLHAIATVYDQTLAPGSQIFMYMDGVLQARTSRSGSTGANGTFQAQTLHVASRTSSMYWANTSIKLLLVFDRALSSDEILSISQNPLQLFSAAEDEEEYTAALPANHALSVSATALSLAGGQVGMRVSRQLRAEPASLVIAPGPVGMRASRKLTVAPAALTLATSSVALRASRRLFVTPAAMVMTGGQVSMLYASNPEEGSYTLPVSAAAMTLTGGNVGMRVSRRLHVAPASLVLAGGAVRTLVGRRLMVSPAGLQLTGGTVTLRFSARGEPFDITKIHPSRLVIFEGSGSRITPFEGSGSRITPFEGSGSRITEF
jgi:hypothetical protein